MKVTAEQKYIRMSPRKVRLVAAGLRGLHPQDAIKELDYMTRRAALPVSKVIKQATANAINNLKLNPQSLRIAEILVNEGATYKRWRPVSRGRAHSIFKRTSHIKVILETATKLPQAAGQTVSTPPASAESETKATTKNNVAVATKKAISKQAKTTSKQATTKPKAKKTESKKKVNNTKKT